MAMTKPAKTPLPLGYILYEKLSPFSLTEEYTMKKVPYQSASGSPIYLSTRTRLYISTAVSMLGKLLTSPAPRHWKAQ